MAVEPIPVEVIGGWSYKLLPDGTGELTAPDGTTETSYPRGLDPPRLPLPPA